MTRLEFVARVILAVAAMSVVPVIFLVATPTLLGMVALIAIQVPIAYISGGIVGESSIERRFTKDAAKAAGQ